MVHHLNFNREDVMKMTISERNYHLMLFKKEIEERNGKKDGWS